MFDGTFGGDRTRLACVDVPQHRLLNDLAARLYLDKSTASRIANGLVGMG